MRKTLVSIAGGLLLTASVAFIVWYFVMMYALTHQPPPLPD